MNAVKVLLAAALAAVSTSALAINEGFESGDKTGFSENLYGGTADVTDKVHDGVNRIGKYFLLLTPGNVGQYASVQQTYSLPKDVNMEGYAYFHKDASFTGDVAQVYVAGPNGSAKVIDIPAGEIFNWKFKASVAGDYTFKYRVKRTNIQSSSHALFDANEIVLDISPNKLEYGDSFTVDMKSTLSPAFFTAGIDKSSVLFQADNSLGDTSKPSNSSVPFLFENTEVNADTRRGYVSLLFRKTPTGPFYYRSGADCINEGCN